MRRRIRAGEDPLGEAFVSLRSGAAAMFAEATLVAIESDPLVASVLRANLAARGWSGRASVLENDYREVARYTA